MKERIPYPALLWMTGKCACVIGGGRVALHRVEALLDAGAQVRIIAPEADDELVELVAAGRIKWYKEKFATSMLQGVSFVVCATNDEEVNRRAAWTAKSMGALGVDGRRVSGAFQTSALRAGIAGGCLRAVAGTPRADSRRSKGDFGLQRSAARVLARSAFGRGHGARAERESG